MLVLHLLGFPSSDEWCHSLAFHFKRNFLDDFLSDPVKDCAKNESDLLIMRHVLYQEQCIFGSD